MSGYQAWTAKQRGKPVWLALGAVALVGGVYLGYNKLWAPFITKRRLAQAEIYGNYIYEQERKFKDQKSVED